MTNVILNKINKLFSSGNNVINNNINSILKAIKIENINIINLINEINIIGLMLGKIERDNE